MSKSIPSIIMLHHVSDDSSYSSLKPYCISKKTFLQLIDFLYTNEYETTTFEEINSKNKNAEKAKRKVIITFDDCPKHLFDFAIPELIKRNMKAVFYMPTAHIAGINSWDVNEGRQQLELMSDVDLIELKNLGMEIGSHSHNHIHLKELDEGQLKYEVLNSKKILESILEKKIISFAYPYGSIPKNYQTILSVANYQFACSIYTPLENNFSLRRFIYHDGDTNKTLKQKLSWQYTLYRFLSDPLKS